MSDTNSDGDILDSYADAIDCPEVTKWSYALKFEVVLLKKLNTWRGCGSLPGANWLNQEHVWRQDGREGNYLAV